MLVNYRMKVKFAFAIYNLFLKIELKYDKENHVNFKWLQFLEEGVL